jgi:hypothetical protein
MAAGKPCVGWHAYKRHNKNLNAFYHEGMNVVVKKPVLILDPRTPMTLRVPTIRLDDEWVAQPIVKKTKLKLAYNRLRKQLLSYKGIHPDLHVNNVGWYEISPNKWVPRLFDW